MEQKKTGEEFKMTPKKAEENFKMRQKTADEVFKMQQKKAGEAFKMQQKKAGEAFKMQQKKAEEDFKMQQKKTEEDFMMEQKKAEENFKLRQKDAEEDFKIELKKKTEEDLRNFIAIMLKSLMEKYKIEEERMLMAAEKIRVLQNGMWYESQPLINIDYNDISLCLGYLRKYTLCHAALVSSTTRKHYTQIETALQKSSLLRDNSFSIVSIGGGPGIDALAFLYEMNELFEKNKELKANLTVVDLMSGWERVFAEVELTIEKQESRSTVEKQESVLGNVAAVIKQIKPDYEFVQADILSLEGATEIENADVVLLIKVMSFFTQAKKRLALQNIFSSMKDDAIILFASSTFINPFMQSMEEQANMKRIFRDDGNFDMNIHDHVSIPYCQHDIYAYQKRARKVQ